MKRLALIAIAVCLLLPVLVLAAASGAFGGDRGLAANGDATADRWAPAAAIFAPANSLRASGAPADIPGAVFAYNHSQAYVDEVLRWASTYAAEIGSAAAAPS